MLRKFACALPHPHRVKTMNPIHEPDGARPTRPSVPFGTSAVDSVPPEPLASAPLTVDMTVPQAVAQLTAEPRFRKLVRFFTGAEASRTLTSADHAQTEHDFQATLGLGLLSALLVRTAKQVEVRGAEHLTRSPACLYISNHRDVLLDSALLNRALIAKGYPPPHIVIGDNLIETSWMRPIFRLCGCIVVQRGLKGKALYEHSLRVSEHVRKYLTAEESVWIAQRQGRTKDGVDKTEPALLRMLLLAYERAPVQEEQRLNATPVAVSYEFEPCDTAKAAALIGAHTRSRSENRVRRDLNDILRGLLQPKGRICLTIRPPVPLTHGSALERSRDRAEVVAELAQNVDDEIRRGYQVWPSNYAAYDLLNRTTAHADRYSPEEREVFQDYVEHRAQEIEADQRDAVQALLALYARSVPTG